MKFGFLLGFLFLFSACLFAQDTIIVGAANADYQGRIKIDPNKKFFISSPKTAGKENEISSNNSNFKLFEKEHNTVWLEFVPSASCQMEFKIEPISTLDDYDFLLYDNSKKFEPQNPIRVNLSRNDRNENSVTGLSKNSDTAFVGIGPGNSFSSNLKLVKGNSYLLVIDNVYGGGKGFKLSFTFKNCTEQEMEKKKPSVNLNIYEKNSKKNVSADVKIILLNSIDKAIDTVFQENLHSGFSTLNQSSNYLVVVSNPLFFTRKIELRTDTNTFLYTLDVELDSIYAGRKLIVENLYFMPGSADILRKSFPALKQLLATLKDNPTVQIEIQGHINEPSNGSQRKGEAYNFWLSEARAKAVYDYLVKRGIDKSRMTYKGLGNTKMIYPKATTPEEMEKNRRVEIEIIRF